MAYKTIDPSREPIGMVLLNRPVWSAPELPFCGIKSLGYGKELSEFVSRKQINVSAAGHAGYYRPAKRLRR